MNNKYIFCTGKELKKLRKSANVRVEEVSELLITSIRSIYRWETFDEELLQKVSHLKLKRLSDYLELKLKEVNDEC